MSAFLDGLDAADPPLAAVDRVLAALGPKMLELARTRTAGTHPYLVTPEHTRIAREAIGADRLVAAEQGVVLDTDPDRARATARLHLATYLGLPNYANNWRRLGYTDDDIADGGSDRLVDALVVWGDESTIAARVQEHRDAGADHVCVQVLTDDPRGFPRDQWRALAPALTRDRYDFDRYLRYDELTAWLHDLAAANPDLVTVESYGHSHEGRDLWLVTVTDTATGHARHQAGALGRRQHPRRRADRHGRRLRPAAAPRRRPPRR